MCDLQQYTANLYLYHCQQKSTLHYVEKIIEFHRVNYVYQLQFQIGPALKTEVT